MGYQEGWGVGQSFSWSGKLGMIVRFILKALIFSLSFNNIGIQLQPWYFFLMKTSFFHLCLCVCYFTPSLTFLMLCPFFQISLFILFDYVRGSLS